MKTPEQIGEDLQLHGERNIELLQVLKQHGIDLGTTREVDHHFFVDDSANAELLVRELGVLGHSVAVSEKDEETGSYGVEATIRQAPVDAASDRVTKVLVELAAKCGAEYDGWGTAL